MYKNLVKTPDNKEWEVLNQMGHDTHGVNSDENKRHSFKILKYAHN